MAGSNGSSNGQVFDLDAIETLASDEDRWPFKFGGETFTFPLDPPTRFFSVLRAGDFDGAMALLLGDDQYLVMDELDAEMSMGKAKALFDAYAAQVLVEAEPESPTGKSSGRSGSRTSTKVK